MISKYFTSPDRYQWTLEGYQKFEKTQSAQSINKLHRYAMVCKQICNIVNKENSIMYDIIIIGS